MKKWGQWLFGGSPRDGQEDDDKVYPRSVSPRAPGTAVQVSSAPAGAQSEVQRMFGAVTVGDEAQVAQMLESGVSPNLKDTGGESPLHWAAAHGQLSLIQLLVQKGADVDSATNGGRTALHYAATARSVHAASLLLRCGCRVDVRSSADGDTALHLACRGGDTHMVQLLLLKKASHALQGKDEWFPLQMAAQAGNVDIVQLLLDAGADVEGHGAPGGTPLYLAARHGHEKAVERLAAAGANLEAIGPEKLTALHEAVKRGRQAVAETLLRAGANPRSIAANGKTVLQMAHTTSMRMLVQVACEAQDEETPGAWSGDSNPSEDEEDEDAGYSSSSFTRQSGGLMIQSKPTKSLSVPRMSRASLNASASYSGSTSGFGANKNKGGGSNSMQRHQHHQHHQHHGHHHHHHHHASHHHHSSSQGGRGNHSARASTSPRYIGEELIVSGGAVDNRRSSLPVYTSDCTCSCHSNSDTSGTEWAARLSAGGLSAGGGKMLVPGTRRRSSILSGEEEEQEDGVAAGLLPGWEEEAGADVVEMVRFLVECGLGKYAAIFVDQEFDMNVLLEVSEVDLVQMGLKIGARRKLLSCLRKHALSVSNTSTGGVEDGGGSEYTAGDIVAPENMFVVGGSSGSRLLSRTTSSGLGASTQSTTAGSGRMFEWVIDFAELELHEELGKGFYGSVWRGRWNGNEVAVKKLFRVHDADRWLQEVELLSKLRHPNIVTFYGASLDAQSQAIVFEYMQKGSLRDVLNDRSIRLDWSLRLGMAKDVAQGIAYLHSYDPPVIHRDLKSENLLVTNTWRVKVTDFGLSRIKDDTYSYSTPSVPFDVTIAAPEVLSKNHISEKADVFSFGLLLWELDTRDKPYGSQNPHFVAQSVVQSQLRPRISPNCHGVYAALMQECWAQDPRDRPTFKEIIRRLDAMHDEGFSDCYAAADMRGSGVPVQNIIEQPDDDDAYQFGAILSSAPGAVGAVHVQPVVTGTGSGESGLSSPSGSEAEEVNVPRSAPTPDTMRKSGGPTQDIYIQPAEPSGQPPTNLEKSEDGVCCESLAWDSHSQKK